MHLAKCIATSSNVRRYICDVFLQNFNNIQGASKKIWSGVKMIVFAIKKKNLSFFNKKKQLFFELLLKKVDVKLALQI